MANDSHRSSISYSQVHYISKREQNYTRNFKNRASLSIHDGVVRFTYCRYCHQQCHSGSIARGGGATLERRYRFNMIKHPEHLIPNGNGIFPPTRTAFPNLEI